MQLDTIYSHLKEIFFSAVDRVDPYSMLMQQVVLGGNRLVVSFDDREDIFDLSDFEEIYVFGAGKATAKMAKAMEEILRNRISGGIISVKYEHTEKLSLVDTIEAGHPIPDANSLVAAERILSLASRFTEKTLVINLISGGGSALLELPLAYRASGTNASLMLADIQATTQVLLDCGATIEEINCIRKHISRIKGGKLARHLYPATVISLILSDVVGDSLDAIASGPTHHDSTSYADALAIVEKYNIKERLPSAVIAVLQAGSDRLLEETPKSGDPVFNRVHNILIGTNAQALIAASKKAEALGYQTTILSSQLTGEARDLARVFIDIAKDIRQGRYPATVPACIIGGGETTVTVRGSGKGGRNQEMALSFLRELSKNASVLSGVYFLSASTDGNDGPTDAAGAFASEEFLRIATEKTLDMVAYLDNNDAYSFFDQIGGLLKTGPTNTNVCDIQVMIVS